MKKKILLSMFAFISIMAANKSFAQYANHDKYDNKPNSHISKEQERLYDIRDIGKDKDRIAYDLKRINEKNAEIRKDIAYKNLRALYFDKIELQRLQNDLASARIALVRDTREVYGNRVAVRF